MKPGAKKRQTGALEGHPLVPVWRRWVAALARTAPVCRPQEHHRLRDQGGMFWPSSNGEAQRIIEGASGPGL